MKVMTHVFWREVQRIRMERGLDGEVWGDAVGLDYRILSALERGEYRTYLTQVEQVAAALSIPPWQLLRSAEIRLMQPGN
jgi:hypothetical protein